jgi:purine-nucleoside phosphorylase
MDTAPVAFAVSRLRSFAPEVALVLGSGLDGVAATISASGSLPYGAITNGCTTTVPGHPGTIVWGTLADRRVLMFRGRFHRYEGHDRTTVCWPVMLSASLGVRLLVLTNAAGGIRTDLLPGTLMLVRGWIDWINWTGREQHKRLPVEDTDTRLGSYSSAADRKGSDVVGKGCRATGSRPPRRGVSNGERPQLRNTGGNSRLACSGSRCGWHVHGR